MRSKTIILWGREDLLGQAVEFYLNLREEWRVIRISDSGRVEDLIRQIEDANPEVVFLYLGDSAGDTNLPMQLISHYPELRVITFSLEDSSLDVYEKQTICVKEISDLFSTVEGNFHPTRPTKEV